MQLRGRKPDADPPGRSKLAMALRKRRQELGISRATAAMQKGGAAVDFGPNNNRGNEEPIHDAMVHAGFVWGGTFRSPDLVHYQSQPAGAVPSPEMVQACARAGG